MTSKIKPKTLSLKNQITKEKSIPKKDKVIGRSKKKIEKEIERRKERNKGRDREKKKLKKWLFPNKKARARKIKKKDQKVSHRVTLKTLLTLVVLTRQTGREKRERRKTIQARGKIKIVTERRKIRIENKSTNQKRLRRRKAIGAVRAGTGRKSITDDHLIQDG